MSARTGLEPLDAALLDAVDLLSGDPELPVRCSDVLEVVARRDGFAPDLAWPSLVSLARPWQRHLPLLDGHGNLGSQHGDGAADPEHVRVRLSPVGALALASEQGARGPVPLGVVEGSLHRGGPVPPFAPDRVVGALLAAEDDCGPPALPTGGTVDGDVEGLLAGRPVRLRLGCRYRAAGGDILITEVPLGVAIDDVVRSVHDGRRAVDPASPVQRVEDETDMRTGVQVRVSPARGSDLRTTVEWLRSRHPLTVDVDCLLPAPQAERLRTWDRGDGTGLRALADLMDPLR